MMVATEKSEILPGTVVDKGKTGALNDGQQHFRAATPGERDAFHSAQIERNMTDHVNRFFSEAAKRAPDTWHPMERGEVAIDQNAQGFKFNLRDSLRDGGIPLDQKYTDPAVHKEAIRQGEKFQAKYEELALLHYRLDQSRDNPAFTLTEAELNEYQRLFSELKTSHKETFRLSSEEEATMMVTLKLTSEVARTQTMILAVSEGLVSELGKQEPDMLRVAQLLNGKTKQEIDEIETYTKQILPKDQHPDPQPDQSFIYAAFEAKLNAQQKSLVEGMLEKPIDNNEIKLQQLERMLDGYDPKRISQEIQKHLAELPEEVVAGLKSAGWQTKVGAGLGAIIGSLSPTGGDLGRRLTNAGIGAAFGAGGANYHDREYGDTAKAIANITYLIQGLSKEQLQECHHPLDELINDAFKWDSLNPHNDAETEEFKEAQQKAHAELLGKQIETLLAETDKDKEHKQRISALLAEYDSFKDISLQNKEAILTILAKDLHQQHLNDNLNQSELESRQQQLQATFRIYTIGLSQRESSELVSNVNSNVAKWTAERAAEWAPDSLYAIYGGLVPGSSSEERTQHLEELTTPGKGEDLRKRNEGLLNELLDRTKNLEPSERAPALFETITNYYETGREPTETDINQTIQAFLADLTPEDGQAVIASLNNDLMEWGAKRRDTSAVAETYSHMGSGFSAEEVALELLSVNRMTPGFWKDKGESAELSTTEKGELDQRTRLVLLGLDHSQIDQVGRAYSRLVSETTGNSLAQIFDEQLHNDIAADLSLQAKNGARPQAWETISDEYYMRASMTEIRERLSLDLAGNMDNDARYLMYQIPLNWQEFSARLDDQSTNPISDEDLAVVTAVHKLRYGSEATTFIDDATTRLTIQSGVNVARQTQALFDVVSNVDLNDQELEAEINQILLPDHLAPADRLNFALTLRDEIFSKRISTEDLGVLRASSPLYYPGLEFAASIWNSIEESATIDNRTAEKVVATIKGNMEDLPQEGHRHVETVTLHLLEQIRHNGEPFFTTLSREIPDTNQRAEIGYQLIRHNLEYLERNIEDPEQLSEKNEELMDQLVRMGATEDVIIAVQEINELEQHRAALKRRIAELESMEAAPEASVP